MRSRHADAFNHDPWAQRYDEGVLDESNPIRAGYAAALAWTVACARITRDAVVMDLGSGTGNTTALIPAAAQVICVDLSEKMAVQAPQKLTHLREVAYVQADMLEVFDRDLPPLDAVVSTYTVHHLTEDEKPLLFARVGAALKPGGRVVFADLMFENEVERQRLVAAATDEERAQTMKSLDEEFPWFVDRATRELEAAGLRVRETRRFSTFSWGLCAEKSGLTPSSRLSTSRP